MNLPPWPGARSLALQPACPGHPHILITGLTGGVAAQRQRAQRAAAVAQQRRGAAAQPQGTHRLLGKGSERHGEDTEQCGWERGEARLINKCPCKLKAAAPSTRPPFPRLLWPPLPPPAHTNVLRSGPPAFTSLPSLSLPVLPSRPRSQGARRAVQRLIQEQRRGGPHSGSSAVSERSSSASRVLGLSSPPDVSERSCMLPCLVQLKQRRRGQPPRRRRRRQEPRRLAGAACGRRPERQPRHVHPLRRRRAAGALRPVRGGGPGPAPPYAQRALRPRHQDCLRLHRAPPGACWVLACRGVARLAWQRTFPTASTAASPCCARHTRGHACASESCLLCGLREPLARPVSPNDARLPFLCVP